MRQNTKLKTETRHCLFPAPLGIDLILFVLRPNHSSMFVKLSSNELALRYISLSGAWVPAGTHAEPSYIFMNYQSAGGGALGCWQCNREREAAAGVAALVPRERSPPPPDVAENHNNMTIRRIDNEVHVSSGLIYVRTGSE